MQSQTMDDANRAEDGPGDYGFSLRKKGNTSQSASNDDYQYQVRSGGVCTVLVSGYAVRLGWDIPIPGVLTVGGKRAVRGRFKVKEETLSASDCPVYMSAWALEYTLDGIPEGNLNVEFVTNSKPESKV